MTAIPEELRDRFGLDADGNPPELHEDLAPHVYDTDRLGQVLKHPLVFQVPYTPLFAGQANEQYAYKTAAVDAAETDGRWYSYVFLHERPYRLDAFVKIAARLTDSDYWELLSEIWVDTENLWQNVNIWRMCLTMDRPGRTEHFMDEDERQFLRDVGGGDGPITIYRGTSVPGYAEDAGLSWTLNRPRAEWFAKRFAFGDRGTATLLTGVVAKDEVIAYLDRRGEWEIIVLPEDVDVTDEEYFEEAD